MTAWTRLLVVCVMLCLGRAAVAAPDYMTAPVPAGYYAFQKVVYQNDGGWPDERAYFGKMLRSVENHITAVGGKVEIRVVSFGAGVAMFQMAMTDKALAAAIDHLRGEHVRFLLCRNTMRGMGLGVEALYGVHAEDVVPSGVAELARLQGLGFVYEHL